MREQFAEVTKLLNYILNGMLDVVNIRAKSLTAEVIKAGTITADEIAALTITAEKIAAAAITVDKIAAGAVTAEKINVDQLSAIAADLGTITAGLMQAVTIYGSYFATSASDYPRVEISTLLNLFTAAMSANQFVGLIANDSGSPTLKMTDGSIRGFMGALSTFGKVLAKFTHDYEIEIGGTGHYFFIPGWAQLYSRADSQTLEAALNALSAAITGKATAGAGTGSAGPYNCGIPIGTQLAVSGGGSFTWEGVPAHIHTQI